jgi:putative addiction module component (TIGR02574 family)
MYMVMQALHTAWARERLVDALLESLDEEGRPLTDAERQELDRRLDAYHRDPAAGSSWEEVKARLPWSRAIE